VTQNRIDTPLTRLQRKHEAALAEKDQEIADLKTDRATLRGVNELLKFELLTLESVLKGMQKNMDEVMDHVRILKLNLPEIEK
jgi:hypothetical protein